MNDIGWAVKQMHNGARVCRPGWNGKGMWLAINPHIDGVHVEGLHQSQTTMTEPFVYMKTAQGGRIPWLCSQADLLATDWEIADTEGGRAYA